MMKKLLGLVLILILLTSQVWGTPWKVFRGDQVFNDPVTIEGDSTTAFCVKQADSTDVFCVDTTNGVVSFGGVTPVTGTRITLPQENDAVTPTLAFGDGDSGFYELTDDQIVVTLMGGAKFYFTTTQFIANDSGGPAILNTAALAATPTLIPNRTDSNTGAGSAGADQLSLIAGGVEGIRITESDGTATTTIYGNIVIAGTYATAITTVSTTTTLDLTHSTILVNASSTLITITLLPTSGITGHIYNIKKIDSSGNNVIVDGNASETIDGSSTAVITTQYENITIQTDGSNWHIL